ncbi:MAG: exo-alpha-sialidase [Bryobacterales bacterium]|nr:exo-alpha-sialidase [Bryobacterales bacterium]
MICRRTMLGLPFALATAGAAPRSIRNVPVYAEQGRFGGWPANFGIWNWGDEIVCGFAAAYFIKTDPERHQRDRNRPKEPRLARSLDGGDTWRIEAPASLIPPEQGGKPARTLTEPMDFTAPGFAFTLRQSEAEKGRSHFSYSTDRARTWQGPFEFPMFGRKAIDGRTDYQIYGKREALVFATAAKDDGQEGRPFCARTTDGGLTWKLQGWIGPEPQGFSIMPSSVRLPNGRLLCAVRVKKDEATDWVDLYASDDQGRTWAPLSRPISHSTGKSGNPPSLKRLPDGRLTLTSGYRAKPYGIHATISDNDGKTWSEPIVLRDDGEAWDLGYTRDAIRTDGKIVTLYYWSPGLYKEREIVATIWDPGKRDR